jgi:hypothetical protein
MALSFEKENYYWICSCGGTGRTLIFYKACRASDRHLQEHERKLEWGHRQDLVKATEKQLEPARRQYLVDSKSN